MYIKRYKKENNLRVLQASIDLVQITVAKELMKNHPDKAMCQRDLFQVFKHRSILENLFIKFIGDA